VKGEHEGFGNAWSEHATSMAYLIWYHIYKSFFIDEILKEAATVFMSNN
jgi:hypothetical protein